MPIRFTNARHSEIGARILKTVRHVRGTVIAAVHEHGNGDDVHDPGSRTEAGIEFLRVVLDELVLAVVASGATVDDTAGDPYEGFPDVIHDPATVRVLAGRDGPRAPSVLDFAAIRKDMAAAADDNLVDSPWREERMVAETARDMCIGTHMPALLAEAEKQPSADAETGYVLTAVAGFLGIILDMPGIPADVEKALQVVGGMLCGRVTPDEALAYVTDIAARQ